MNIIKTYIFVSALLFVGSLTQAAIIEDADLLTTIILIEGEAHLVDLAQDGEFVVSYGMVPSYFTSSLGHDEIVARSVNKYKENADVASRIKFISFESTASVLDEQAVDYIRSIAVSFEADKNAGILLTIGRSVTAGDVDHQQRINTVKELLTGFGVDKDHIQIKEKTYLGTEPNQFLKIELIPSL